MCARQHISIIYLYTPEVYILIYINIYIYIKEAACYWPERTLVGFRGPPLREGSGTQTGSSILTKCRWDSALHWGARRFAPGYIACRRDDWVEGRLNPRTKRRRCCRQPNRFVERVCCRNSAVKQIPHRDVGVVKAARGEGARMIKRTRRRVVWHRNAGGIPRTSELVRVVVIDGPLIPTHRMQ